ncbi:MAG: hypothetical protein HC918_00985 [Oscillatoriales cyanobacterium SM2_1_8]|nr:hypothetical protein [Oscillatoriales cyanobacterium SM2_1_8]
MNTPASQTLRLTAELQAAHAEILRQQQVVAQLEQQVATLQTRIETLRLGEPEAYIVELQEQVLQQASQAAEREATVQYWKEQSLKHQRHALQLSSALDRLLTEREPPSEPPTLPVAPPPVASPPKNTPPPNTPLKNLSPPTFRDRQRDDRPARISGASFVHRSLGGVHPSCVTIKALYESRCHAFPSPRISGDRCGVAGGL